MTKEPKTKEERRLKEALGDGSGDYYGRDGEHIPLWLWAVLIENKEYRIVQQDTLPSGVFISTVWLGLAYNWFGDGSNPLIFETMVFPKESSSELECERYSTEEQAKEGHLAMLAKWTAKEKVSTREKP